MGSRMTYTNGPLPRLWGRSRTSYHICLCDYSRLPHNPYPSVDCSGYGVLGSMDSKKRPNKGQTNKILFKNPENRSEDRYTMLLLLRLPECVRMRLESLSRRLNIIFFYCFRQSMVGYKVLTSLVGVPCHNFATFGHLLFTKQYLAVSQAVLDSFRVNFIPNCRKSSRNTYGFCLQRGMGYGLLRLYGL